MTDLFSSLEERPRVDWRPEAPPPLDGIHEIELDTETNGLRWWAGDRPIGIAIRLPDGRSQYLPWGHKGGGNLDEAQVKRWAERELRGKRITNLNTRFDLHMLREWGVDLEAQGCEVSDVGHYAALLDDHRLHFSLESIAQDYLGIGKSGQELDKTNMAKYHAGEVAAYACRDVELVGSLKAVMWPKLTEEGLHRVRELEDRFIWVVCECEKNAERINVPLLDEWVRESERELYAILFEIILETGIKNFNPSSPKDLEQLFNKLHLSVERTETGRPSFTASILKTHEHPTIKKVLQAKQLTGLRTKYLLPYAKTVDRGTGIIRYSLHQLRAIKDEYDERDVGTVSGRCSATQVSKTEGFPMQGVMKPEKQKTAYGDKYIIRQLHIPDDGMLRLSADAMQIEYRLFAHETNSPRLLQIFKDDPEASFHKKTHEIFLRSLPKLTYRRMKDTNFAEIYGAGLLKKALMLEYITKAEWRDLNDIVHTAGYSDPRIRDNPKLQEVRKLNQVYQREIPESRPLQDRAKKLAEDRGYIRSILGRRSRFINGARSHKALNTRIQPSGADILKQKMVELHAISKEIGFKMRLNVHDEVDGDTPDREQAMVVSQLLNQQSFRLRVPILWETSVGPNWYEQTDLRDAKQKVNESHFEGSHS